MLGNFCILLNNSCYCYDLVNMKSCCNGIGFMTFFIDFLAFVDIDEEFYDNVSVYVLIEEIIWSYLQNIFITVQIITILSSRKIKRIRTTQPYSIIEWIPSQVHHLNRVIGVHNSNCIDNLWMDHNAFKILCMIMKQHGGLVDGKCVTVKESSKLPHSWWF